MNSSSHRKSLSAEAIVSAAIELADSGGMELVSMRSIAARLGYRAMSLYYYVPDKQTLVSSMVDAVMRKHHYPAPEGLSWRQRLQAAARLDWDMYMRHPWLLDNVATTRPPFGPETLAAAEWVLDALAPIELSHADASLAMSTINHYIQGSARITLASRTHLDSENDEDSGKVWQSRLASRDLSALPRLQALVSAPWMQRNKSRFEDGLDLILDGLARRGNADLS